MNGRPGLNDRVVGRCSQCGGLVVVPTVFHSVVPPVPRCINCGAIMDQYRDLPIVPTRPIRPNPDKFPPRPWRNPYRPKLYWDENNAWWHYNDDYPWKVIC